MDYQDLSPLLNARRRYISKRWRTLLLWLPLSAVCAGTLLLGGQLMILLSASFDPAGPALNPPLTAGCGWVLPVLGLGAVLSLFWAWHLSRRDFAFSRASMLAAVLEQTSDLVSITDRRGRFVYLNPAFERATGYRQQELLARPASVLKSGLHPAGFYRALWQRLQSGGEFAAVFVNRRRDGALYQEDKRIRPLKDAAGRITHFVATGRDITDQAYQQAHLARLQYLAYHDPLTELPNRLWLSETLHRALAQAERYQRLVALMYLDLDGFKPINDRYGHQAGDQLLRAFAHRVTGILREGDVLARLGGDEFVVLIEQLEQVEGALAVADKIVELGRRPFEIEGHRVRVACSLGIVFHPFSEVGADELLSLADSAMYQAKRAGRGRVQIFCSTATAA